MSVRMPYRAPAGATIDFPAWVKITRCEHVSQTRFFDSAHGRVRFVTYQWTDHGRVMDVWRTRQMLAAPAPVVPVHRARHFGRRLAS